MATYTADDFARADFARHPDGGLAMRVRPLDARPWETWHCYASDATMALTGWVPVPHGSYTRHDSPDYADGGVTAAAIEKEAERRPLTAREHLQLAWDAAHVPVDGIIPAGAEYIYRLEDGRVQQGGAAPFARDATEHVMERRLLDPPTPSRPDGAEEIEAVLRDEWTFSDEDGGEDAFADLAERLASRGVRVVTEEEARHATDE